MPNQNSASQLTASHSAGVAEALRAALANQADTGLAWLDAAVASLANAAPNRLLFTAFAAAPRQVGREELPEMAVDAPIRLDGWTRDQVARVLLLLARQPHDDSFLRALDNLFGAADLAELVCLHQSLPLLPLPERHVARAAEGVRSNMLPVFKAVAIGNPYPAEWFDEGSWNQLVLKAVFVGCRLHGIDGLDRRANPTLARMLVDYARERRAASRVVTPDLWRPVGPFADNDRALRELHHALDDASPVRRRAAALALAASPHPHARALLETRPEVWREIQSGRLSWQSLADEQSALAAAA